ncbi:MAG: transketolase [Bacteriovoracaceae bacterium]|nr:transketolase [Bacteriovoracaceae bacterium]
MANALRVLSMDAIQKAKSGHPGMPLGMADVATVLFQKFLKFDPQQPDWPDRDRFVLSAGHGSMLLYSLLHLSGYEDITLDDIKQFRQLGSKTAGHPEYGLLAGIETTTGPLGQGIATACGMATSEKHLAAKFGKDIVDHFTYVIAGDGCLMEGVSYEAISLAGHLGLNKLIVFWDDNGISIDGNTDLTTSEDMKKRFEANQWSYQEINGHDYAQIADAIKIAQQSDKPSLIACNTVIGYGSPSKAGTAKCHGAPLGEDEIIKTKSVLGCDFKEFEIPNVVYKMWETASTYGKDQAKQWMSNLDERDSLTREEFWRTQKGEPLPKLEKELAAFKLKLQEVKPNWASRKASQEVLEVINDTTPETIGGSADLTGSNLTKTQETLVLNAKDPSGRYIHYGVREHAMAAYMNGIALHKGLIPYGGTFMCFSDYMRGAIRLSALSKQRVIYVLTHDSIGLGEDGPTHQPVEHLASLRAMPGLNVFRPSDAVETLECWQIALSTKDTPSILALSRQGLAFNRVTYKENNLSILGAYEVVASQAKFKATLYASGSEVAIAMTARALLEHKGIGVRVVSVPCMELFFAQPQGYRDSILQNDSLKIAIEAGVEMGWHRFIGDDGVFIGMDSFGESAPIDQLYEHFKITPEAIVQQVLGTL